MHIGGIFVKIAERKDYDTDLKDILAKLDNRLERIETRLEILPKIEAEVVQLKESVF